MNYIDHSLIAVSTITECVSISSFGSLVSIPKGTASSTTALKTCSITAGIKKYKSINKKRKKHHDEIALLAKSKLNSIEVWISKALVDSNITYEEFVLINNVLKKICDMKEEIKNYNNK